MGSHAEETQIATRKRLFATISGVALAATVVAAVLMGPAAAQAPPATSASTTSDKPSFGVASIKPNKSGNQGTYLRRQPGGLYTATNAPLRALIASAYTNEFPPKGELIFGGPAWIDSERFDIEARADGNPGNTQMRLMVQALLEDRFKLVMHHETRQLPVYELVLSKAGKTGPQLTPHSSDAKCTDAAAGKFLSQPGPGETMPAYCGGFFMNPRPGDLRVTGNKITMDMLAQYLNQFLDHSVVDKTGVSGIFDFALEFAPQQGPGSQSDTVASASDPSAPPSLFTALQEQLGLKLESTKGPVDVLVIDHVEEPSPN